MYRIFDTESQEDLISAERLSGFFVDSEQPESGIIHLENVHQINFTRRRAERAELQVANSRQEKIGAYYLGRVDIVASADRGHEDTPIEYSFEGYTCEYSKAGEIWQRWASGEPLKRGEWTKLPAEYHESWLHVSQTAWFTAHQGVFRLGNDEMISIDGGEILTTDSFYCALGEAINGPGGYFGSNLDALAKCLSSAREKKPLPQIRWDHFSASREKLGEAFVAAVESLLNAAGVHLISE